MPEPFAHYTGASFDPLPQSVTVDSAGSAVYTTPADARIKLRDLARLNYVGARLRVTVRLNQSTSAGAATVRLTDGSTDLASAQVDLSSSTHITVAVEDVDVSGVSGSTGLRLVLDVDTAADSGTSAEVAGVLDLYHPLVLLSGC